MKLTDLIKVGGMLKRYYQGTPGSYTVNIPSDVSWIFARIQAGGGSGGSIGTTCTGGGSGEFREVSMPVTPGGTITVVVGAGGTAVYNAAGVAGGQSSVGTVACAGGAGGLQSDTATAGFNPISGYTSAQFEAAHMPALAGLASTVDTSNVLVNGYKYGSRTSGSASGGAPSMFSSGTNCSVNGSGAPAASLGAGSGGAIGTGASVGKGGDGFVEIFYASNSVLS